MALTYTKDRTGIAPALFKLIQVKLNADPTWVDITFFGEPKISIEPSEQNLGGENSTAYYRGHFEFLWLQSVHGTDDVDIDKFKNANVDIRFQRKNLSGSSTTQAYLFSAVRFSISSYAEMGDKVYYLVSGDKSFDTFQGVHITI